MLELGDARTQLMVALRKDAALLGEFQVYRREVLPLSDKQITLLKNSQPKLLSRWKTCR